MPISWPAADELAGAVRERLVEVDVLLDLGCGIRPQTLTAPLDFVQPVTKDRQRTLRRMVAHASAIRDKRVLEAFVPAMVAPACLLLEAEIALRDSWVGRGAHSLLRRRPGGGAS